MGFAWSKAPQRTLIPAVKAYPARLHEGIVAVAMAEAAEIESDGKTHAPWVDRSGAARSGLRAFVVDLRDRVVIYFVHSVDYGPWLERGTANMAPRPTIMPTLRRHYAPLMASLRRLVS